MNVRHLVLSAFALATPACWIPSSSTDGTGFGASNGNGSNENEQENEEPECRDNAACAHFDTDSDACTRAVCRSGRCQRELVTGTAGCQCHTDDDCSNLEAQCSSGKCVAHECHEVIAPAGPAPATKQRKGDCSTVQCDGQGRIGKEEYDAADVPDDGPCVTMTCDPSGVRRVIVEAGTACNGDSVCLKGKCLACAPKNAATCGGAGANEPANDNGTAAAQMAEYVPFCAYSDGTDADWYTFHADDASFSYDILAFEVWSSAPNIELCAYVQCDNGQAPLGNGCSATELGPNGSKGCCWSGAPSSVKPSWDLDCPGTGDDSGTVYVRVRTPGAASCERYALSGGY